MSSPKKKKRSPLLLILLISGVVLILIVSAMMMGGKKGTGVTVGKAEKRTLISSVSESGTVEPLLEVKIAPDVSGEVVELYAKEGAPVKRGDLLAVIRPDNYQTALHQTEAGLSGAIAMAMQAESAYQQAVASCMQDSANFVRNDQLFKQSVISRQEWETFKLKLDVARNNREAARQGAVSARYQVESSRANVQQARQNLNRTSIVATMDGILTKKNCELGERVVGTMQMQGTEILRIADLSRMMVKVEINENDIRFIELGDSATILVDAFGEKKFKGRVIEVAYSPVSASGIASAIDQVTNFEVKVEIDPVSYKNDPEVMRGINPATSPFRPGMSAQVEIYTDRVAGVVAVPIAAVTVKKAAKEGDAAGEEEVREMVFLKTGNKATERVVITGLSDDKYIEIKEGLKEGEEIITGPYVALTKELKEGTEVEVISDKPKGKSPFGPPKEESADEENK